MEAWTTQLIQWVQNPSNSNLLGAIFVVALYLAWNAAMIRVVMLRRENDRLRQRLSRTNTSQ